MKRWQAVLNTTRWLVALLIVIGVSYDIVIALNDVPNDVDTISAVVKRIGWRFPVLPFALSGLLAHFWLAWDGRVFGDVWDYMVLILFHPAWYIASEVFRPHWGHSDDGVFLWMLLSILFGLTTWMIFWPQSPPSKDRIYG